MSILQLTNLHPLFDNLQQTYGEKSLCSVYGAGCIIRPKLCLMFMNPTARNISCLPDRGGIRAPRVGFKQTRKMIYDIGLLSDSLFAKTQGTGTGRSPQFVEELYTYLANQGIYITNLAKCTQRDAKALPDSVFKAYIPSIHEELMLVQPEKIVTFGNQVSSILLNKPCTVSSYNLGEYETLTINNTSLNVYPCRYPVGMGYRNIAKAKERIHYLFHI